MRPTETDDESSISVSYDSTLAEPGPSFSPSTKQNGSTKTNGFSSPYTNGNGKARLLDGLDGHAPDKARASIARVSLPGSTLYDDSFVDREEFVRLVIQSLRDVGYIESAATLEAESGYTMETHEVSDFRQCILEGAWSRAEIALERLGVAEDDGLWRAKFLINEQKYLELLEANKIAAALNVLRQELAPLSMNTDQLHSLSSLLMCSDPDELRQKANWDGAAGTSRRQLLVNLQRYIPSSVMIPQRRFATLLDQARLYQQSRCLYHNSPSNARTFSLYTDHLCDNNVFPRVTTTILEGHSDEVWNLQWSHSGNYLATAGSDKTAIIWRVGSESDPYTREYHTHHILREHPFPVGCVAWSPDDSILLTAAENFIKMWNTRTGVCMNDLNVHTDVVTALEWLPNGSGFISGGLDGKIVVWDADGKPRNDWGRTPIRVTDLAITPDYTRLVAVGMYNVPSTPSNPPPPPSDGATGTGSGSGSGANATAGAATHGSGSSGSETRVIVYQLATKQIEASLHMEGELTSVKVSEDSRYALINRASKVSPNAELQLWDLDEQRMVRKYTGHQQSQHVIRSCFGGVDGSFVASGSEDGKVYVWHRDTGDLLEVLAGHGEGSVNSVAWNPRNEKMFASCSDDKTIRIWEAPP
ncbi:WD40 repeat-like protein, partial [Panus rudis PR-1116 ss-1]